MRRFRRWASPALALAVLAVVIWRLGTGPFLAGVEAVDGRALLAASAIFFVTTVFSAWRWTIVSRGLGIRLSLTAAVAAYYRAVFLNLVLPGGVAGDVHRGVSHGREVHDVGRAMRAVVWERSAGQVVQILLLIAVLLVSPSPVRSSMPFVAAAAAMLTSIRVVKAFGTEDYEQHRLEERSLESVEIALGRCACASSWDKALARQWWSDVTLLH